MIKFSLIAEQSQERYYKCDVNMTFIVKANSAVEAGYDVDNIAGGLETQTHYEITSIDETSMPTESVLLEKNEMTDPSIIISEKWNEMKNKVNDYEFYHLMRMEKFDGEVILNTIKNK